MRTGIWEATPGETVSIKGESFEFCHILEGVIELTEDGQPPVTTASGRQLRDEAGLSRVWKTLQTVRKIYVSVG